MKLKAAKYDYFYEFTDAIVIADMKDLIESEKRFKKQHKMQENPQLLKAAKVILDYYTP